MRLTPRVRELIAWVTPVLVLFVCVTAYWAPALDSARTVQASFTDSDVVDYFRPISIAQFDYAHDHGVLSDWNNRVGLGYPAVGQLGNQYLPRIETMRFASSPGGASDLIVWMHALIAAFAAFALARRLGISRWAAVVCSLAYVLSHLTVRWAPFFHSLPYFAAFPLAWLGIELVWQRERLRGACILALGIGMACLGGHLQNAHMLLQVLGVAIVFRWLTAGGSWRERLPALGASAAGYAAGILLSLPALLPFIQLQDASNRSGSNLAAVPGFTRGILKSVMNPGTGIANINGDLYLSFVVVPFIFAGVLAAVRSRRMALVLLIAVLALLIGMKTELLTLLSDFVPGWRLISNALRLSFVLTLPLALLAGAGIDLVARHWRWWWTRGFAVGGLLLSSYWWLHEIHIRLGWDKTHVPVLIAVASLVLFIVLRFRTTWAVATVLGLALVAPLTATALTERSLGWLPQADSAPVGYAPWLAAVEKDNDNAGRWMSWCQPLGFAFAGDTHRPVSFLQVPGRWLDAYDSFLPTRYFNYWRTLTGSQQFVNPVGGQWYSDEPGNPPPNATLTNAAGVRRILSSNGCGEPPPALGWRRIEDVGTQTVWANDGAFPEAFVSHRWKQLPKGDGLQAVTQLAAEPSAFSTHADQIEGAAAAGAGTRPERARLERPSGEHLVARLSKPATGTSYLIVAEGYNAGWRASVDGHSRTLLAANGDFQAVQLEPGDQVVTLRFAPFSKSVLTPLSYVLSILMIAGCLMLLWWRRERADVASDPE